MELTVGKNSYITLEEAKQLLDDYVIEDTIIDYMNTLDDNFISKIINRSTKMVNKLHFKGYKVDSKQELNFPRYEYKEHKKLYVDCPEDVKVAIVLQAIYDSYFLNKDEMQLKKMGVSSYSVDGASISFNKDISDEKLQGGIYKDIFEDYLRKYTIYA